MQVAELPRWIVKDDAEVRDFSSLVLVSFEEIRETLEKEVHHIFKLEVLKIVCCASYF